MLLLPARVRPALLLLLPLPALLLPLIMCTAVL
jgi:hypothetical protein